VHFRPVGALARVHLYEIAKDKGVPHRVFLRRRFVDQTMKFGVLSRSHVAQDALVWAYARQLTQVLHVLRTQFSGMSRSPAEEQTAQ
jgi:hypothetical protein